MSIQEIRQKLHKAIDETDNYALLHEIYLILTGLDDKEWEKLPDKVKESIELSLQKAEAGNILSHEEAVKRITPFKTQQETEPELPDTPFRHSLIDPEDEKNIQRIWKSPGGC